MSSLQLLPVPAANAWIVYDRDFYVGVISSADLEAHCPEWQHVITKDQPVNTLTLFREIQEFWASQNLWDPREVIHLPTPVPEQRNSMRHWSATKLTA